MRKGYMRKFKKKNQYMMVCSWNKKVVCLQNRYLEGELQEDVLKEDWFGPWRGYEGRRCVR